MCVCAFVQVCVYVCFSTDNTCITTFVLYIISDPPGMRTTTWHVDVSSATSDTDSEDKYTDPVHSAEGLLLLATAARRVWDELYICKKPVSVLSRTSRLCYLITQPPPLSPTCIFLKNGHRVYRVVSCLFYQNIRAIQVWQKSYIKLWSSKRTFVLEIFSQFPTDVDFHPVFIMHFLIMSS